MDEHPDRAHKFPATENESWPGKHKADFCFIDGKERKNGLCVYPEADRGGLNKSLSGRILLTPEPQVLACTAPHWVLILFSPLPLLFLLSPGGHHAFLSSFSPRASSLLISLFPGET